MYVAAVLNIGGWLWVPQNDVSGGVMQVTWREGGRMFISMAVGSRRTLGIRVRSSRFGAMSPFLRCGKDFP